MRIGITYRLFAAILAAACLSVVSMFFVAKWNIDRWVSQYVGTQEQTRGERLATALTDRYGKQGNWDFLHGSQPDLFRLMAVPFFGDEQDNARRTQQGRPVEDEAVSQHVRRDGSETGALDSEALVSSFMRRLDARVLILDAEGKRLFGSADISERLSLRPLLYKGRVIGRLGIAPRVPFSAGQLRLLKRRTLTLAMMAGAMVLVAGGVSFLLARWLVRPVKALASGTDRMARGDFDVRVPVLSSDELGLLARRFNSLAQTLKKNEQARRQLVADVSHELRTPIAVLRSEIEAIQDGVRSPTPDAIRSLNGEVLRLARVVDDLYQLSLSDLGALSYHKERIDLNEVLRDSLSAFQPEFARKEIDLAYRLPDNRKLWIFADPERLGQLFANLLGNSLKYTDSGGCLEVDIEVGREQARIELQDSAPGIPETDLPRLFDRLYRVEASRNRVPGGAGLGLAISRNIIEAHGGSINAKSSSLGGLCITIILPLGEGE